MHSAGRSRRTKRWSNISDLVPRLASTKLAAAVARGALTLAVLSALLLIAVRPAQAQTETVLYNFTTGFQEGGPQAGLTTDGAGNFYGTTFGGGLGWGTVFELSRNGSGGWNQTVLYTFTGGADGGAPVSSVIFDSAGNLYGTTELGGGYQFGVVFELSPLGTSWTETVLHGFAGGADGAFPLNGLIIDPAGNLFGTTYYGGVGGGTVFELSPSGGGWTEQTIYSAVPSNYGTSAGLTMDAARNIFGVSYSTIFELSPTGTGGWNPTVIHTFVRGPKAGNVMDGTPVLDKAGNLYGTTSPSGAIRDYYGPAFGTVYELSPKKNGKWTKKILHTFGQGGALGGIAPYGGLVLDTAGNIYGTTLDGSEAGPGPGTVFELVAPVGKGSYTEKVLWSFNGIDGAQPNGSLILDSAGNLYGTTAGGGSSGNGVVFQVTP